jgi:hypothetical protein
MLFFLKGFHDLIGYVLLEAVIGEALSIANFRIFWP